MKKPTLGRERKEGSFHTEKQNLIEGRKARKNGINQPEESSRGS